MDTIWCDKIVTVNRWTNVFLLIPSVLALTQTTGKIRDFGGDCIGSVSDGTESDMQEPKWRFRSR